jgi:hypothetical protein
LPKSDFAPDPVVVLGAIWPLGADRAPVGCWSLFAELADSSVFEGFALGAFCATAMPDTATASAPLMMMGSIFEAI